MEINKAQVVQKYNSLDEIWSREDKWHTRTFKTIQQFISKYVATLDSAKGKILNAGSTGYAYGLSEQNMIHLDIAAEKIAHLPNSVTGSIEKLPFKDNEFDLIVCVGSVINYNDPMKVFEEFDRVLRPGGYLVVEYENSNTLELVFTERYNKKAILVDAFYYGVEPLWYYSDTWIREIIGLHHFKMAKMFKFHYLSPFIYRFVKDENKAGIYMRFDWIFRRIPGLRHIASNTIRLIQKP